MLADVFRMMAGQHAAILIEQVDAFAFEIFITVIVDGVALLFQPIDQMQIRVELP